MENDWSGRFVYVGIDRRVNFFSMILHHNADFLYTGSVTHTLSCTTLYKEPSKTPT